MYKLYLSHNEKDDTKMSGFFKFHIISNESL